MERILGTITDRITWTSMPWTTVNGCCVYYDLSFVLWYLDVLGYVCIHIWSQVFLFPSRETDNFQHKCRQSPPTMLASGVPSPQPWDRQSPPKMLVSDIPCPQSRDRQFPLKMLVSNVPSPPTHTLTHIHTCTHIQIDTHTHAETCAHKYAY